ncbi:DUF6934 family protein [Chryseolinea soli]|uniref:Uncharacterized protein n=1 Tax=Chryseolinea soli TaxID=2321403 RepID=A0A385SNG5_9BACT|nr:hypothetical protein [Chryseolinea soli]AYB33323.1 hypothetical protein D4L85_23250 [Chryseolinea soli]
MDLKSYESHLTSNHLCYTFTSKGPRGEIQKVVKFKLIHTQPIVVYNLAFGDANDSELGFDEDVISDNGDRVKVLQTVANIAILFCRRYPQVYVMAKGRSAARNRLYQMMISNRLAEIEDRCEIFGILGSAALAFRKNVNYEGFLVKEKRNKR